MENDNESMDDFEKELDDELDEIESELEEDLMDTSDYPSPFNNPKPENPVGHVVTAEGGLRIGRGESNLKCVIYSESQDSVEIGDYIRIPYYYPGQETDVEDQDVTEQLLGSIEALTYMDTSLTDTRKPNADSYSAEQYTYFAEVDPISVVGLSGVNDADEEEGYEFEAEFVSKPPRPTISFDTINNSEFLRTGLGVPNEGIYVGDMAVNNTRIPSEEEPLEYYLQNDPKNKEPVIFRHIIVAGSTGSGKTHTSKNILRQFTSCPSYKIDVPAGKKDDTNVDEIDRDLNITIIDPEDEYTGLGNDPKQSVDDLLNGRKDVESGGIDTSSCQTDFNVFAPVTTNSNTSDLSVGSFRKIGIPFEIVRDFPELMMPGDATELIKQLTGEVVREFFRLNKYPNKNYTEFRKWYKDEKRIILKEGDRYGDKVISGVTKRVDRESYNNVFDNGSNSLLDKKIVKEMFAPDTVSVITTGHLAGSEEEIIIQSILSHIVDNKISSDPRFDTIKGTPLLLAVDEAHEYLKSTDSSREYYIVDKFRTAAKRGRKDKFGLYLITQNPGDIDHEVQEQLNTKIYLHLKQQVVNESDVYVPGKFKNQISEFGKGQMMVKQPNVKPVEVKGLPRPLTEHE